MEISIAELKHSSFLILVRYRRLSSRFVLRNGKGTKGWTNQTTTIAPSQKGCLLCLELCLYCREDLGVLWSDITWLSDGWYSQGRPTTTGDWLTAWRNWDARRFTLHISTKLWNAKGPKGSFCFLFAGSLWHKDKWLPCTENIYYSRPNAIKTQRRQARNIFNICRKKKHIQSIWVIHWGSPRHPGYLSNWSPLSFNARKGPNIFIIIFWCD